MKKKGAGEDEQRQSTQNAQAAGRIQVFLSVIGIAFDSLAAELEPILRELGQRTQVQVSGLQQVSSELGSTMESLEVAHRTYDKPRRNAAQTRWNSMNPRQRIIWKNKMIRGRAAAAKKAAAKKKVT